MIGMLVTPYAEDAFGQLGIQWIVGTPRKNLRPQDCKN